MENISSFMSYWTGGRIGGAASTPPALTPDQAEEIEEAKKVGLSWGMSWSNMLQLAAYPLAGFSSALDIYNFADEDDENINKANLSLDSLKNVSETGDELVFEGIEATGLDLQIVKNLVLGGGVMIVGCLRVQRISFKGEFIEVGGSLTLNNLELRITPNSLLKLVASTFVSAMRAKDTELSSGQDKPQPQSIKEQMTAAVERTSTRLLEQLRLQGITIGSIDMSLKFSRFGMDPTPAENAVTSSGAKTNAMVLGLLRDLDLDVGETNLDLVLQEPGGRQGEMRIGFKDSKFKLGNDKDGITIKGGTAVDLGGGAKAQVGTMTVEVAVLAWAQLDAELGQLTIDWVAVIAEVTGSYAGSPVELELEVDMHGLVVRADVDKGTFVNCIAREVLSGLQFVYGVLIGDGEPTGMTPEQLHSTFVTMAKAQVHYALLKQMKVQLGARIGSLAVSIKRFAYGDYSGHAVLELNDLEVEATLDPKDTVKLSLTADVLVSGLLAAGGSNMLSFDGLSVTLDENGDGAITGHFQVHSDGLTEMLGNVVGKLSKTISKEAELNVRIKNYNVELASTNLKMSSAVLNPLVNLLLNHIGVGGNTEPGLGLTGKLLRKPRVKKLVRGSDLGQHKEEDSILVDAKTARGIFESKKSQGAVNLLAFLQGTIQTKLDALRVWEPDFEDPPEKKPEPEIPRRLMVEEVPLTTKKQIKAAEKLRDARAKLREALKKAGNEQDKEVVRAAAKVEEAEQGLQKENQKIIDACKKEVEKGLAEGIKEVSDELRKARKGEKSSNKSGTDLYREEVTAAHRLLTNNCLIDAIAAAAGRGRPTIEELVQIRSTLRNVGQMMLATPTTVAAILAGLGLPGRRVIVFYPSPIPYEDFPGGGAPILVNHTGRAHFVAA